MIGHLKAKNAADFLHSLQLKVPPLKGMDGVDEELHVKLKKISVSMHDVFQLL